MVLSISGDRGNIDNQQWWKKKSSAFNNKLINNDGIAVFYSEYLFTTFIIDYIPFKIIF